MIPDPIVLSKGIGDCFECDYKHTDSGLYGDVKGVASLLPPRNQNLVLIIFVRHVELRSELEVKTLMYAIL